MSKRHRQTDNNQHPFSQYILDILPDAFIGIDENGVIISANNQAERLFGYAQSELINQPLHMLLPRETHLRHIAHISGAFSEQTARKMSSMKGIFGINKKGKKIAVDVSLHFIENNGRKYAAASIRDIRAQLKSEKARLESEEKYRILVQQSPFCIHVINQQGVFTSVNPAGIRLLGLSCESDALGMSCLDLICYKDKPRVSKLFEAACQNTLSHFEFESINKRWFKSCFVPLKQDKHQYVMGISEDITEVRLVEMTLRESEQRWKFALEGNGDGVWDWDVLNNYVVFSSRWKAMLGFSDDEIGNTIDEWFTRIHPDDINTVMSELHAHLDGLTDSFSNEHRVLCKNGQYKWILDRAMVVSRNEQGKPERVAGTHSDISERKDSEKIIWRQANFDSLTHLPNRNMFNDRLEQELNRQKREQSSCALLLIDLDHFKNVNDSLGHDVGDLLLLEVAHRIVNSVRITDTVSRFGGDEYTVILSGLKNVNKIEEIAKTINIALLEPFNIGTEVIFMSASIGIALCPDDASNQEDLFKFADQAMYKAKKEGRNRYSFFTKSLQDSVLKHRLLGNDLRAAIEYNQLEVYYQPIVTLSSGEIHKAEALIRWNHPRDGLISPDDFIPIAEETGLIIDIGNWVFKQTADQVSYIRSKYHADFKISINKSPVQFYELDSQSVFNWINYLRQMGLSGESIVVEITEGLLLDNHDIVMQKIDIFREAKIQISLDDFGTGYSSLAYLKKFNIDYLKIDKTFIKHLETSGDDNALCEAIIVMAHKLGIKVIAEGIETLEQFNILLAAGCDFGQGYLFSKPVPANAFERVLQNSKDNRCIGQVTFL